MTTPRLRALEATWRSVPPLVVTVHRLANYIGVPAPAGESQRVAKTLDEALEQAASAGLPVMHGRPNDPMLALVGL
jgi:hypothetical protein